jgi:uncharacterized protein (DUF1778 family)
MTASLRSAVVPVWRYMDMAVAEGGKRETLNIRVKPEVRGLIDRAAELAGKNRKDFVLDAVRHAAEQTLLDRTVFVMSPKAYSDFVKRLDAPPKPNARLRKRKYSLVTQS